MGTVIVTKRDAENEESVEVGRAEKLFITTASGSVPPAPLYVGNALKFENVGVSSPLKLVLQGLKTPMTTGPQGSMSQALGIDVATGGLVALNHRDKEIENLYTVVKALVNMLGGAVTIQYSEMTSAEEDYDLHGERTIQPGMFVITTAKKGESSQ